MALMTLSTGRLRPPLPLDFRQEAHRVLSPTVDFRVPLLTPVAFDFGNSQSLHTMEVRASRTSSSLKGLIMAMTIFMDSIPA